MMTPFTRVRVGRRVIGTGNPIFLIADMGLTHDGDITKAMNIAKQAAVMGADAVKIQVVDYDMLMADRSAEYTYQTADGVRQETLYDIFRKIWLEPDEIKALAALTRELGIELIATSDYESAVDILEDAGVNCHKIDTWSATHKRLVQRIGETGKPMMLDMGYSTQHGLGQMLDWFHMAGGHGVLILHDFRTDDPHEMNFRNIPHLQQTFGYPVGFTPQGRDERFDYVAVGLGVEFLEKRITLDRNTIGNGHFKALDVVEWGAWAKSIRHVEAALGNPAPEPPADDLQSARKFLKSLYLARDVTQGQLITDDDLQSRRPGTGVSSDKIDQIVGRPARRDLKAGDMLDDHDVG